LPEPTANVQQIKPPTQLAFKCPEKMFAYFLSYLLTAIIITYIYDISVHFSLSHMNKISTYLSNPLESVASIPIPGGRTCTQGKTGEKF